MSDMAMLEVARPRSLVQRLLQARAPDAECSTPCPSCKLLPHESGIRIIRDEAMVSSSRTYRAHSTVAPGVATDTPAGSDSGKLVIGDAGHHAVRMAVDGGHSNLLQVRAHAERTRCSGPSFLRSGYQSRARRVVAAAHRDEVVIPRAIARIPSSRDW